MGRSGPGVLEGTAPSLKTPDSRNWGVLFVGVVVKRA